MKYKAAITKIYERLKGDIGIGNVASYIPALSQVSPDNYAIAIADLSGRECAIGDSDTRFTIQSISKVFTLAMVSNQIGEELWESVGREPSGSTFNSLIQLEQERGIPRNPFINAGALVVTDRLIELYSNPKEEILKFVRTLAGDDSIDFDEEVAQSELITSHRNIALANFMKSFGTIKNSVEEVIDVYTSQCAIAMSASTIARSFLFLANGGVIPATGERVVSARTSKRLNALMSTCGLYNESGDFAYRVGLPGKSGVGGGIVAIIPGTLSVAVWSPELNVNGNSCRGINTLEQFTTEIGVSLF